jgi:hypothetical protein
MVKIVDCISIEDGLSAAIANGGNDGNGGRAITNSTTVLIDRANGG